MPPRAARVLLGGYAAESLGRLKTDQSPRSHSVVRRIDGLRAVLLEDALHGEVVPRSKIPQVLIRRHGIDNLYVEDLPDFWRLLYTLTRLDGERLVVIIEVVDHKAYSRWFPGRGR